MGAGDDGLGGVTLTSPEWGSRGARRLLGVGSVRCWWCMGSIGGAEMVDWLCFPGGNPRTPGRWGGVSSVVASPDRR
ncbi:hypothetical protein GCM10009837_36630 [Streptomyces durmitorensis]